MKPIIKNDKENRVVLNLIERLMKGDPSPRTKEGRLLNLLAEVVEIFEKKYSLSDKEELKAN